MSTYWLCGKANSELSPALSLRIAYFGWIECKNPKWLVNEDVNFHLQDA